MVFCNKMVLLGIVSLIHVTILILIDGFLQFELGFKVAKKWLGHNPYFNRWFSAIKKL